MFFLLISLDHFFFFLIPEKYNIYDVKGKKRMILIIVLSTSLFLISICIGLTVCNMRKKKKLTTIGK